jgi:hypothetical protein
MLQESEVIFDGLREQWAERIGHSRLDAIEAGLAQLTGPVHPHFDAPGWSSRDLGGAA